ncbi:uncharacterized protein LY79DRAFT_705790 [Colletotrichum navitas]|uniref:Uncharacterized protein n=1 Tax=Colletotrichum navitas TaxID=681940 RepID=A0AAD8PTL5_9PEZI|nr:uncharacterized protein LY79DRAFT_705790 [Colletotrichum navitas]KAK1579975.1 hypothetical protein LY79DRAFT_705790 [Colletotrichum navitas]
MKWYLETIQHIMDERPKVFVWDDKGVTPDEIRSAEPDIVFAGYQFLVSRDQELTFATTTDTILTMGGKVEARALRMSKGLPLEYQKPWRTTYAPCIYSEQ